MQQMTAAAFKNRCLAVVGRVGRTGEPVTITRYGRNIATLVPADEKLTGKRKLGGMEGTVRFMGDIVNPLPRKYWGSLAS